MTYRPDLAETVPWEWVAEAAVVDLEAACDLYGRDTLPYPLGRSRPVGSVWLATRGIEPVEDRPGVRDWLEALMRSGAGVGCRVHHSEEDTPDLRLHGLRADEAGFIAVQGSNDDSVDIVDVYRVSLQTVGSAMAESVGLVGPGFHPRIAVAGDDNRLPDPPAAVDEYDDLGLSITRMEPREPAVTVVSGRDVVTIGTVQAWHDLGRPALQWVRIRGDGDYVYEADNSGYLEPLDVSMLSAYLDSPIGDVSRW